MANSSQNSAIGFSLWQAIRGYPTPDQTPFEDAFGVKPLPFMCDGTMIVNHCGGTNFHVWLFWVNSISRAHLRGLIEVCDAYDLWFLVEPSYKPGKVQIAVMREKDEFES